METLLLGQSPNMESKSKLSRRTTSVVLENESFSRPEKRNVKSIINLTLHNRNKEH